MNISILTIGDELLIGQVVNTNASWMAQQCTSAGASIVAQSVVADKEQSILSELERLSTCSEVILVTGGLGPTHDDITKEVVARFVGTTLEMHQPWLDHLTNWMKQRGREISERNKLQALVPKSARVLNNPLGTAPGLWLQHNSVGIVCMPGVPDEMKYLVAEFVLPFIRQQIASTNASITTYRTLHTTGIPESTLADLLGDIHQLLQGASLAFLPNYNGVRLRIGVTGTVDATPELDRIEREIRAKAGHYIFAVGTTTLAESVAELLINNKETVSVAESCTGGMLGAAFTAIPGSSAWMEGGVISYSYAAKTELLGIPNELMIQVGAVSEEVAAAMSNGIRTRLNTTYGIGITGVAGPSGGTPEKPVGTVWISVCSEERTVTRKFVFGVDRNQNRERSVGAALGMLREIML